MFQRLLFERIEQRILVGTLAFLGIMVVTGWIAINEGARMRSFEEQFLARSTERGASLFATNCATCHGADGRGLTGVAPGLNNPALFGHNFFAEIDATVAQLTAERDAEGTTEERIAEIDAELADLQAQRDQLLAGMQAAIDRGYDPDTPDRLDQLGWTSTRDAFIYTTLVHGRPTSGSYWPQAMPYWAQTAGGPLRNDQLRDLTNYVLNFDKGDNWTVEDLLAVQQFAKLPADSALVAASGGGGGGTGDEIVGLTPDIAQLAAAIDAAPGDPVAGQNLYNGALGCAGCHTGGAVGPATEGTWTRVQEQRLAQPEFAGYTGTQYLVESIIHPNEYVVPNYSPVMPTNFGSLLTQTQLADLVAFLQSQDQ